jgi:hypothetical protein
MDGRGESEACEDFFGNVVAVIPSAALEFFLGFSVALEERC